MLFLGKTVIAEFSAILFSDVIKMTSKLRIKGRILLVSNVGLMSLVLATALMLTVCINFSVLIYELFLREALEHRFSLYMPVTDMIVSLLLLMLSFSVYWQIRLGADRFFLRRSQKKGAAAGDIFYYFHPLRAFGAFSFCVRLGIIKLACFLVSFMPFGFCIGFLIFVSERGVSALVAAVLACGGVAFFFSGAVFYRSITSSLFLARYHFISGDCLSFKHLISSSQENMKNNRKTLLRLKRSFLGWFLLCLLLFPIGYVWSYYNQTLAVAAAEFIEE